MANPVWSQAFIQYGPSAGNTQFEVPTGYTAVVRQLSCVQNAGGFIFQMILQDSEEAPGVYVYEGAQVGTASYVGTEGRWVCPGGGIITLACSSIGSDIYMYAGGYLLANTYSR